ncbi:MAG TPA: DUF4276 family protein [Burkholderiaceae bacterium]|nr:DUF4276 family protein [Burkholderiaceae bacterium]
MTRAFISYSHADDALRAEFNKHLSLLRRQGLLELWSDHRIPAGGEFDKQISAELEAADIVILLISPDFMASDYCYGIEMKRAMERHLAGSAAVIPIILRPVDWHSAPCGALKALPRDGKPVVKWPTLDDALLDVVQALRSLLADGWILIVLDAHDDCPATLGAEILGRARAHVPHRRLSVVLANREFEAWFIAAADSLDGNRGFSVAPDDRTQAESPRDAKGWMRQRMRSGRYSEMLDQPAFTARFDLQQAYDNSRSFRKLCAEWRTHVSART